MPSSTREKATPHPPPPPAAGWMTTSDVLVNKRGHTQVGAALAQVLRAGTPTWTRLANPGASLWAARPRRSLAERNPHARRPRVRAACVRSTALLSRALMCVRPLQGSLWAPAHAHTHARMSACACGRVPEVDFVSPPVTLLPLHLAVRCESLPATSRSVARPPFRL